MRWRGGLAVLVTLLGVTGLALPTTVRADTPAAGAPAPATIHVEVYAAKGVGEPTRRQLAAAAADGVREALADRKVTHGLGGLKPLPGPASADKALARSDKALTEAKKRVRNLEEGALDLLDWAADEYARYLPQLLARDGNARRLVSVYAQTAIASFMNGETEAAQVALRRVLVLEPKLEYDPKVFPPQLEELILQEGLMFEELGQGSLEIEVEGGEATVFVNGLDRGKAPVTVDDLPSGPNIVTLVADGVEPVLLSARVEGGKTTSVKGTLKVPASVLTGVLSGTRGELGSDRAGAGLRRAASSLEAGGLVLVVPKMTDGALSLVAYVYDMRGQVLVGRTDGTVDPRNPAPEAETLIAELVAAARWKSVADLGVARAPIWERAYRHEYFWHAVGATAGVVVLTVAISAATGGLSPGKKVSIFPVIRF